MIRRVLAEPLIHFVVIAAVMVGAQRVYATRHDRFRIVMTPERVSQVVDSYRGQFGVEPGPDLREALVQEDFEDEVLYRQALALNLDRDDEVIRRRLIQKMRFVAQDQHAPAEPSDSELRAYFASHRDRYRKSPAATFTHVFFSADIDGNNGARTRASASLVRLQLSGDLRAPNAGDHFPDSYDFSSYEPQQVGRLFGETTQFSDAVFAVPEGRWTGPFESAYGWHLLRVDTRRPPRDPSFDEVKERVRGDYLDQAQNADNAAAIAAMKKQFTLIRQDRAGR